MKARHQLMPHRRDIHDHLTGSITAVGDAGMTSDAKQKAIENSDLPSSKSCPTYSQMD
jgi:hypothetical protein